MITVQILTKNNEKTIKSTLDSLSNLNLNIIVGDLGSSDDTLDICKKYKVDIIKLKWEKNYSKARNELIKEGINFYIDPWETIVSGQEEIAKISNSTYVCSINNGIVSKELRFWKNKLFQNPVFETITDKDAEYKTNIILKSNLIPNRNLEFIEIANKWMNSKPTQSDPYYYLACSYLSNRMYKEFFTYANQYLAIEKKINESSIMLFYYMAQIELHMNFTDNALKKILFCISMCPTFSEFWCLLGDIIYKQKKYKKAKSIYENAIIIGKRRIKEDIYPIEIAKYKEYPEFMIKNIEEIKEKNGIIIQK